MKIPLYSLNNYSKIIGKNYEEQDTTKFIELKDIIKYLNNDYIKKYSLVNATKIGEYISKNSIEDLDNFVASKLLIPTLWTCDYFFRNQGLGTHHGIDIIMPKGTPIPAFYDGVVDRIKKWDGIKKNEGNCIVIKSNLILEGNVYICFEHLDSINVNIGQKVSADTIIGTCGSTGNSTQYHLHLQFDKQSASFHPFYSSSKNISEIQKFTYDPIFILRKIYNINPDIVKNNIFNDLSNDSKYFDSINSLYKLGIVKGFGGMVYPNSGLKRYEFILILYRLINKFELFKDRMAIDVEVNFTDVGEMETEFLNALNYLATYGLININKDKFNPTDYLNGEETLAFLGRLFYSLNDSSSDIRYESYKNKFIEESIIDNTFDFWGKSIFRQDLFFIIHNLLLKKKLI